MSATHPICSKAIRDLSTVLKSPTLMGHGKGGEVWICLTCYEGVLDDRLYRKLFGGGAHSTGLHQLIQWLNFIVPETRLLPGSPGMITLTSSQRHTVYLWIAVHRRLVYLHENPNVKKLLDDGLYIEKAFPSDLFPALNGNEALYLDAKTRDFKGYTPNGIVAELRGHQVLNTKLSDSLAMSDDLVSFLDGVSSGESEVTEEASSSEEESRQSDNGDDDKDDSVCETMRSDPAKDQVAQAARDSEIHHSDTPGLRKVSKTAGDSALGPMQTPPRGQKRDHEGTPIAVTAASTHKDFYDNTSTTSSQSQGRGHTKTQFAQGMARIPEIERESGTESEKERIKRAETAWINYLQGSHCS